MASEKMKDVELRLSEMLGKGSYSLRESARLAETSPQSTRRWFCGRQDSDAGIVLQPEYRVGNSVAISFLDLVDLLVVGRFRKVGVTLPTIRRVYSLLQETLSDPHPFSHRRLLTDGRRIFLESCNKLGDAQLEDVLTGQIAFHKILSPYLKGIDYSENTQIARRWRIDPGILIDPCLNFGKPILAEFGISTRVIADSYAANQNNSELVADLYGVSPAAVLRAVSFQKRLAA